MNFKIFKIKKTFKKRNFQINADFYWKIILFVSFIIILTSFGFGFYLFTKINKDVVLPVDTGSQTKTISKERINKVLQYFTERNNKSIEIINSTSAVVDPSL